MVLSISNAIPPGEHRGNNPKSIRFLYEKEFHSILTSLSIDENDYFNESKFCNSNFTVDVIRILFEHFFGSGKYDNSRDS